MKFDLKLYISIKFGKVSSFLDCLTIYLVDHKLSLIIISFSIIDQLVVKSIIDVTSLRRDSNPHN
jgi:hypothetical protein